MKPKHIVIRHNSTRILLNKAKSKILRENPSLDHVSNEYTVDTALAAFIGGQNGKRR